jgi:ribosome-binding protein aMBF1 (putative translation factor)
VNRSAKHAVPKRARKNTQETPKVVRALAVGVKRISRLRGISTETLAEMTKVPPSTIRRIKACKIPAADLALGLLDALAVSLGVSVSTLLSSARPIAPLRWRSHKDDRSWNPQKRSTRSSGAKRRG